MDISIEINAAYSNVYVDISGHNTLSASYSNYGTSSGYKNWEMNLTKKYSMLLNI